MQTCLCIPELLNNIFQKCSGSEHVALASVCRSFSHIALDIIWRDVEDLKPFLACLPVGLPVCGQEPQQITVSRPIVPSDIQRFHAIYARRIKVLTIPDIHLWSKDEIHVLQQLFISKMLVLPSLVSLDIGLHHDVVFFIPALLSPKITTFITAIPWIEDEDEFLRLSLTLMESLPGITPNLQIFTMSPQIESGTPKSFFASSLRALQGLSASLTSISAPQCMFTFQNVLQLLSNTDSLTFLSIGISNSSVPTVRLGPVYSQVRTLELNVDLIGLAVKLVEALSLKCVTRLGFFVGPISNDKVRRLALAVEGSCDAAALRDVSINVCRDSLQKTAAHPLVSDHALIPFLTFPNMTCFVIQSYTGIHVLLFELSPQFVRKMKTSWPKLYRLNLLRNKPFGTWVPDVKLVPDLLSLMSGCPKLCHIGLDLDYTCGEDLLYTAKLPPSIDRVVTIETGHAPVAEPELLAAILSGCLPNAKTIYLWSLETKWTEFQRWFKMMKAVRLQERSSLLTTTGPEIVPKNQDNRSG